MQKIFCSLLILVVLTITIHADSLNSAIVNFCDDIIFAENKGFAVRDDKSYVTYIDKMGDNYFLKLAVSENYSYNFTYYELYNYKFPYELKAPVIFVNQDNSVDIFFIKSGNKDIPNLYKLNFANGEIVDIVLVEEDFTNDFDIHLSNNKYVVSSTHNLFRQVSYYQHFTDKEISILSDSIEITNFTGIDLMSGRVHSNSDIWLRNIVPAGGTAVNPQAPGWPLFINQVSTTNNIRIFPTGANLPSNVPVELVFQGGYKLNQNKLDIYKNSNSHSLVPFGYDPDPNIDIVMVQIEGNTASLLVGNIIEREVKEFIVYTSYPDALHPNVPIGDSLFTNYVTILDTLWTPSGSITLANSSVFIPATLWIKGVVQGTQVWHTSEDAYIIGHISYQGTPMGQSPEDNETDFFGLISEKSVYIKYKYKDPDTGAVIYEPTAVGPSGNTYVYGAIAALGKAGEGEWGFRQEGVFSFEYQHPHGSPLPFWGVSPYTGADTLFTHSDLHRFKFPPDPYNSNGPYWTRWPGVSSVPENGYPTVNMSAEQHYYSIYDYPWYNPNYPEMDAGPNPTNPANQIIYMRGNLWLFGSVAQIRRGFMRRTGIMSNLNPDIAPYWDIDNYVFGGAHYQTGYNVKRVYDQRLENNPFPSFPAIVTNDIQLKGLFHNSINHQTTELNAINNYHYNKINSVAKNNIVAFILRNKDFPDRYLIRYSNNNGESFENHELINTNILCTEIRQNNILILAKSDNNENLKLFILNSENGSFYDVITPFPYSEDAIYKLYETHNKLFILTDYNESQKYIYDYSDIENPLVSVTFETDYIVDQIISYSFASNQTDTLYIAVNSVIEEDSSTRNVFFLKLNIDGLTPVNDEVIMPGIEKFYLTCYPNPFNPETTIEFNLPQDDFVSLNIYNIKGQKVKGIVNETLKKGKQSFIFNGKDNESKPLASGMYFAKLNSRNHNQVIKILLLK